MIRRLTTILILVCLKLTVFGQSGFYKALTGLSEIDYVLTASKDCATERIQDDLGCNILPIDNWYNQRLRSWKSNSLDMIDYKRIKTIESFAIKGTKELQPKTYGRADVIKWTFLTMLDAKNAELIISKADLRQREDLHKAPWTYWRDRENLYFILTGGTYVKPDLDKIEKKLKEKLNGG
jgi:hypothetical protein